VEFFRKEVDIPFNIPDDLVGPYPSGAPAIFVDTFAKLGGKSGFIGTVGEDDFGDCIINRLRKDNVDIKHIIKLEGVTTGTAFTTYFSDGSRKFIYHMSNAAPGCFSPEHINENYITSSKWLHISGNVLCFSNTAKAAILKGVGIAYQNNIPISLDPNMRLEMMNKDEVDQILGPVLKKATMFLPSEGEVECITGISNEAEAIDTLLDGNIKMIAKKEGNKGCKIFTREHTLHFKAFTDIEAVDPTGCGDSFAAALVYGYLNNIELKKLGYFANAVGAITATQKGAMEGINSYSQVIDFLKKRNCII
jgi:sugar/nucleoside kinase (ribokinase family)